MLPNGKRVEKAFPTKPEALKWESIQRSALSHVKTGLTCGKWLNRRIEEYEARNLVSIGDKRRTFSRFFKDVDEHLPVAMLTPEHALRHLSKVVKEISGDRANRSKRHLIEAWSWGVRFLGLPSFNPFAQVPDYPTQPKDLVVPKEDDFWSVVEQAQDQQEKTAVLFLYYTACRRGELLRLQWSEIDFDREAVRLSCRKGRNASWFSAWVRIPEELIQELKRWKLQAGPGPQVFRLPRAFHFIQDLCQRAGVPQFGFHSIRHLVAVQLYRAGHTVAEIQTLLRHRSPQTTEIYLRSLGVFQTSEAVVESLGVARRVAREKRKVPASC
jgi:integrase